MYSLRRLVIDNVSPAAVPAVPKHVTLAQPETNRSAQPYLVLAVAGAIAGTCFSRSDALRANAEAHSLDIRISYPREDMIPSF